jgi:dynein heavy chain 1
VNIVAEHFTSGGLVMKCLEYAMGQEHIMDFTRLRALGSLFSMFKQAVHNVITYNQQHPDFPMEVLHHYKYIGNNV